MAKTKELEEALQQLRKEGSKIVGISIVCVDGDLYVINSIDKDIMDCLRDHLRVDLIVHGEQGTTIDEAIQEWFQPAQEYMQRPDEDAELQRQEVPNG